MQALTEITGVNKITRRAFFKRAARRYLFSDWVTHILAFLVAGAFFVGINQLGTCVESLIFAVTGNIELAYLFSSVYIVLSFAVTIPVLYGVVKFEINAVEGNGNVADIFNAFSSAVQLNRTYKLFFFTVFRTVICYLPFAVLWLFLSLYYYEGIFGLMLNVYSVDLIRLFLSSLLVMFLFLGLVLSAKYFTGVYVSVKNEEMPVKACFLVASNCNFMSAGELSGIMLSFLPLCILSLFTAGLLFILYTVPYILITMIMVSKYVVDVEMSRKAMSAMMYQNENNNNEMCE